MAPQPDLYLVTYLLARLWIFIGITNVLQPKVNCISKQIFICDNLPASRLSSRCPIISIINNNNNLLAQQVDEIYMPTNSIISNNKNLLARLLDAQ